MVNCRRCLKDKPEADFGSDKRKRNGLASWCRECHLGYKAEWRKTHAHRERWSAAMYRRKQKEQRPNTPPRPPACEICKHEFSGGYHDAAVWDHNHETGLFRGWICKLCNPLLGYARDQPETLRAAAAYLEERGHAGERDGNTLAETLPRDASRTSY